LDDLLFRKGASLRAQESPTECAAARDARKQMDVLEKIPRSP
jgi:hypothetical protein